MPTPSKFIERRRLRVLEILAAGGSRREAARAAGIDGATLHRWIARGKTAHPEGRWNEFYRAVREAEAGSPILVQLQDQQAAWERDPMLAWAWLQKHDPDFAPVPTPEPVVITIAHSVVVAGPDNLPWKEHS